MMTIGMQMAIAGQQSVYDAQLSSHTHSLAYALRVEFDLHFDQSLATGLALMKLLLHLVASCSWLAVSM